jgi:hypothetical protein
MLVMRSRGCFVSPSSTLAVMQQQKLLAPGNTPRQYCQTGLRPGKPGRQRLRIQARWITVPMGLSKKRRADTFDVFDF